MQNNHFFWESGLRFYKFDHNESDSSLWRQFKCDLNKKMAGDHKYLTG